MGRLAPRGSITKRIGLFWAISAVPVGTMLAQLFVLPSAASEVVLPLCPLLVAVLGLGTAGLIWWTRKGAQAMAATNAGSFEVRLLVWLVVSWCMLVVPICALLLVGCVEYFGKRALSDRWMGVYGLMVLMFGLGVLGLLIGAVAGVCLLLKRLRSG